MTYLLTQMAITLLLAMVAGGAFGWLLHRRMNRGEMEQLQAQIDRQHQQVKQAQSEVAVLADDYDDLKQRSQDEIERLQVEARQVPTLHQNLEKSQLLVRQLMQKHEQQLRDIGAENESLRRQARQLADRERALQQLQAGLEARQQRESAASEAARTNRVRSQSAPQPGTDASKAAFSAAAVPVAPASGITDSVTGQDDSEAVEDGDELVELSDEMRAELAEESGENLSDLAAHVADLDTEEAPTIVVDAGSASSFKRQNGPGSEHSSPVDTSRLTADAQDISATLAEVGDEHTAAEADEMDELTEEAGSLTVALAEADRVLDQFKDKPGTTRARSSKSKRKNKSTAPKQADDESQTLFDPVDQHDDLKVIFGIGPVIEQGLNRLGITSYSQLAELKRQDIEDIARALRMVPDKIERDDWVGNARRQLEDVLEDL